MPDLKAILSGTVVILGVGNVDRGDDGAGPILVRKISGRTRASCIDGGTAPENFLEKIVQLEPDTVIIVDAADFGETPGAIRLFESDRIASGGLSTHAISLDMTCRYLNSRNATAIYLLAIQPVQIKFEGLSPEVQQAVNSLADTLMDSLPNSP